MRTGLDLLGRGVTIKQAVRKCFDKVRYATKNAARDRAARMHKRHPDWEEAKPYPCNLCDGFHLTTVSTKGKPLKLRRPGKPANEQSSGGIPSRKTA